MMIVKRSVATLALVAAAALSVSALAQEDQIKLKPGTGLDVLQANCGACHSLDYIPMNSAFLDKPRWDAAIKKMQGPFGATISDADAGVILEYLTKNYAPQ